MKSDKRDDKYWDELAERYDDEEIVGRMVDEALKNAASRNGPNNPRSQSKPKEKLNEQR